MIVIGKFNTLKITGADETQYILSDGEQEVFLARTHLNAPVAEDLTEMDVFVYTSKQGTLVATTQKPYAQVGQFAYLKVVAENPAGVFLDLGIDKDLFLPLKEQRRPMVKGKSYVVYIYLDPSNGHMVGSSKIYKHAEKDHIHLNEGEQVDLLIYDETDLGYNAVINNQYTGLLYFNELFEDLRVGNRRKGWIKKVYPDGKVDLSLQEQGYGHILSTKELILGALKKNGGHLPLGDKSDPADIYQLFKISKKAFKKTIGSLYKERRINVSENDIHLLTDPLAD